MAKDLVRTRHSITKFYSLKSQLQGVSLRMQTLKSAQAMADAMRGVTSAMKSMNTKLNIPSLQNILKEFERQNEKMEMTTEVMGDAVDDAFAVDDEEEETEELVNAVLDELGCNVGAELISAPAGKVSVAAETERTAPTAVLEGAGAAESAGGGLDDDLQARLDALRK
jgi:charged multivesicular body protein 2A|tara:strand:+ start:8498 stop:9001 length:504 start_codon:yes stop_codon:yes gene_type:complete